MQHRKRSLIKLAIGICLLVLGLAIFFFYNSIEFAPRDPHAPFEPRRLMLSKNIQQFMLTNPEGQPASLPLPVSLTAISAHQLIIANYSNLYLLNTRSGEIRLLPKPNAVVTWNPTGVKYCPASNTLFVANYKGQDILTFHIEHEALVFNQRYTDPKMRGPENIDVSKDCKTFAVADYDASRLFFFDNEAKAQWSYPVNEAHGVAFTPDEKGLLASSLTSHTPLMRFDLQGNLLRSQGSPGWGEDQYLWPTAIAKIRVAGADHIALSDAHSGKITLIDANLKARSTLGGNGVGLDLFNMPYAIEYTPAGLMVIADSFKERIVTVDPNTQTILAIYHSADNAASGLTPDGIALTPILQHQPLGRGYWGRTNHLNAIDFAGVLPLPQAQKKWWAGYGMLAHQSENVAGFLQRKRQLLQLGSMTPGFSSSYYYWTFVATSDYRHKKMVIVGSPQAQTVLVFYDGMMSTVELTDFDYWLVDDYLLSSQGKKIALSTLARQAGKKMDAYRAAILAGEPPLTAMRKHLYDTARFDAHFPTIFTSAAGKLFYQKWMSAEKGVSLKQAALDYMDAMAPAKNINLVEFAVISTVGFAGEQ